MRNVVNRNHDKMREQKCTISSCSYFRLMLEHIHERRQRSRFKYDEAEQDEAKHILSQQQRMERKEGNQNLQTTRSVI